MPPFINPNVERGNYWKDLRCNDYEHVIFTTSASPFKDDYSDVLMSKIMQDLPEKAVAAMARADCKNT